jgi:hypothetical protein
LRPFTVTKKRAKEDRQKTLVSGLRRTQDERKKTSTLRRRPVGMRSLCVRRCMFRRLHSQFRFNQRADPERVPAIRGAVPERVPTTRGAAERVPSEVRRAIAQPAEAKRVD